MKKVNSCIIGVSEKQGRENETEPIFEKIMVKNISLYPQGTLLNTDR